MAGAGLFGAFGAVSTTGTQDVRQDAERASRKIHFWITFIAYYAVFFPRHYLGISGMMRRLYDPNVYEYLQPLQPVNVFITISAFVLFTGQLIFIYNYFSQHAARGALYRNPWNAAGLEWSTPPTPATGTGRARSRSPPLALRVQRARQKRDFTPQWEAE